MNKKLLLLAVPVALLFGGCQSYTKPPMAITHSTYTDIPDEEKVLFPEEMKVLTLEKARELALNNNPDFLRVKFSIDSARARYYQSFSTYAPTLNAGMSVSQSFSKVTSSSSGEKPWNYTTTVGPSLNGTWLIFDSLGREMNILSQKYSLNQAKDAQEDAKRLLLRTVAYSYNDVQQAISQKAIAEAQIDYSRKMLKETQDKYDAGTALLSDVLNFEITLKNGQLELIRSEYNIRAAKKSLSGTYCRRTDCRKTALCEKAGHDGHNDSPRIIYDLTGLSDQVFVTVMEWIKFRNYSYDPQFMYILCFWYNL